MKFALPTRLSANALQELERASVAASPDNMPSAVEVRLKAGELILNRRQEESGNVLVPWQIDGAGQVMARTASLMERSRPYLLPLELLRGKLNQVRGQAADWAMGGLHLVPELEAEIRQVTRGFAQAVLREPGDVDPAPLGQILADCYRAADRLVDAYVSQCFKLRHDRQPRLDTQLGVRLGLSSPGDAAAAELKSAFNVIMVSFPWSRIEPAEGELHWEELDRVLHWADREQIPVIGGPLVDFSGPGLPDWLWRDDDLGSQAGAICRFAERVVQRYRGQIRVWQLAAACNYSQVLGRSDEELLWLTLRLFETARQVDGGMHFLASIAQPWGEYLATQDRCLSPFLFADHLLRSGVKLSGLDLEIVMGCGPRGSYCRDVLELSRLIDLYTLLGMPLQITLGYPSESGADACADPDMKLSAGHWDGGFAPEIQAQWAACFAALALCKPSVHSVQWAHCSDAEPHLFPHAGLVDARGHTKPALAELRRLRQEHLL